MVFFCFVLFFFNWETLGEFGYMVVRTAQYRILCADVTSCLSVPPPQTNSLPHSLCTTDAP